MNTQEDITRIAEQLLRFIALDHPDTGVYENTTEMASNFLLSLLEYKTYVFDYTNLQESIKMWEGLEHVSRIATVPQDNMNLLCKITFPKGSPINTLLYLSVSNTNLTKRKKQGASYGHLTLPDIKSAWAASTVQITPRSLGLHTIVHLDPHDNMVNVDLCCINEALQKDYQSLGGSVDYMELYHRTLFSMTYALENMLCKKERKNLVLPPDAKGHKPLINYTQVKILEQPDKRH